MALGVADRKADVGEGRKHHEDEDDDSKPGHDILVESWSC